MHQLPLQNVGSGGIKYLNIHYENNGTGRDSYIFSNNGGFTIPYKASQQMKPSNLRTGLKVYNKTPKMKQIGSRPLQYHQDGTGRDSYIYHNSGGFGCPDSMSRSLGKGQLFENNLRQYQKSEFRTLRKSPSMESIKSQYSNKKKLQLSSSKKIEYQQPEPDYFMEGQLIIPNQKQVQEFLQLSVYQKQLTKKLSQPKLTNFSELRNKYETQREIESSFQRSISRYRNSNLQIRPDLLKLPSIYKKDQSDTLGQKELQHSKNDLLTNFFQKNEIQNQKRSLSNNKGVQRDQKKREKFQSMIQAIKQEYNYFQV